ncbi:AraC-like DNA-binding protein [Nocardia bhagyanarayanae]|uniref:AraC-like DNA-binding protein n=2 Tax=Nocardia bhagyanarayanae TaxID=1215925 RepID=A0A543EXG2_9NOCA|nr:AraC-like DNA-binding protein [Nocardia bhagyanarayanae]
MTDGGGARRWRGIAALSPGRLVIVGRIGTAALHAHHSVQVIVADENMVLADAAGEQVVCRAAVVPPDVAHAVIRCAPHGAVVHLDPESAPGARWAAVVRPRETARGWACAAAELGLDAAADRFRPEQCLDEPLPAEAGAVERSLVEPSVSESSPRRTGDAPSDELADGASRLDGDGGLRAVRHVAELSPGDAGAGERLAGGPGAGGPSLGAAGAGEPPPVPLTDEAAAFVGWVRSALESGSEAEWLRVGAGEAVRHPAVAEVLRLLPERIAAGPVRLADLARAVHLSESRLAHVFSAELGLPFRPYLRWLRVQRAAELLAAGHSLTDVAHGAGFADSAHLTRVCRAMFGAPPSEFGDLDWRGARH